MRNFVYSLLTFIVSIIMIVRLALSQRGRARLKERLGIWGQLPCEIVWFHGASLGEIEGLAPIIERFSSSDTPILCTTTSLTGAVRAQSFTEYVRLLPFDSATFIYLALRKVDVKALIVGEAEIWPALFRHLKKRGVPIFIVNGRLSESSYGRFATFKWVLGTWAGSITKCCVVDDIARSRYEKLGIPLSRIEVTGNAKYDRQPKILDKQIEKSRYFPNNYPTIIIGSIRPGEETLVFPALKELIEAYPNCNIVVAPRHKEKFALFEQAMHSLGLKYIRWSESHFPIPQGTILYLDTIGLLETFYSFAEGAFIGGTLSDYGGHNPMEPAPYRVAVSCGPFTSSTGILVDELESLRAVTRVKDQRDLFRFFASVCSQDSECAASADRLYTYWAQNRGAAERIERNIREVCSI